MHFITRLTRLGNVTITRPNVVRASCAPRNGLLYPSSPQRSEEHRHLAASHAPPASKHRRRCIASVILRGGM